ncbi:hypothetical protein GQ53DRAFT_689436 [Thozetella sp. PMI_491]|nr:hypothetical protein GQ53DRAFT_689436 [Thozetella sp. PMI_491]
MGIPHLKRLVEPYSQSGVIQDRKLVIDGPAFAYHVLHLCLRSTRDNLFDQPSYQTLGVTAIRWLDQICVGGNEILAIYFDGFLPDSKKDERLRRTIQTSRNLVEYHSAFPNGVPAAKHERKSNTAIQLFPPVSGGSQRRLPLPTFAVPSILEALRNSDTYGHLVKMVVGEADVFCAKHAALHAVTVLTSDSDLLVYKLEESSYIVFINDIALVDGAESNELHAQEYRPYDICQRLALDPDQGLLELAFELVADHHLSLKQLLERAKQNYTAKINPEQFITFKRLYDVSNVALDPEDAGFLDPRVSEVALGWFRTAQVGKPLITPRALGEGIAMYLPPLLDSPSRSSAWDSSRAIRKLAYSFLQLTATRPIPSAVEFRRIQSASKGTTIDLYHKSELQARLMALKTELSGVMEILGDSEERDMLWSVAFSAYLDIIMSESQGKVQSLSVQILQNEAAGILNECSWDFIHFAAQIQGTLYSLRILQQLLRYVYQQPTNGIPDYVSGLESLLNILPPLSRFPSVREVRLRLLQIREAGGWSFLPSVFGLSGETDRQISAIGEPVENKHKKRKRRKSAHEAPPARSSSNNPFDVLDLE